MFEKLLLAAQLYEEGLEPGDLVSIHFYSDGSGDISTTNAGEIHYFYTIEGAVNFLSGTGAA